MVGFSMFAILITSTPRIFRVISPAVVWPYLAVAVVMAAVLLARFLMTLKRRRTARGPFALALAFLFFPLMALSMVWPITLPVICVVMYREHRASREKMHRNSKP